MPPQIAALETELHSQVEFAKDEAEKQQRDMSTLRRQLDEARRINAVAASTRPGPPGAVIESTVAEQQQAVASCSVS